MKKAFIALTALCICGFSGCQYIATPDNARGSKLSPGFNQETYVWEDFNYSTNSVPNSIIR